MKFLPVYMSDKLAVQEYCAGNFTWFLPMLSWLYFEQPTTPCTPITVVHHLELYVAITFHFGCWFFTKYLMLYSLMCILSISFIWVKKLYYL